MTKEKHEKLPNSYDLIKANLELAVAKVGIIPPTAPIHVVMRYQQAMLVSGNHRSLSLINAYREIRSGQPISALFRGIWPAIIREGAVNLLYKGALIKGAPSLIDALLPDPICKNVTPTQYHLIRSFGAGLFASVCDALFGGPLDMYATYRSTSQGHYAAASIMNELKKEASILSKIKRLYRGFEPTTVKGTVSFTTFYASAETIRNTTIRFFGLSPKDAQPWYCMAISALLCGFSVALTSSAFDIVKTQAQMPGGKEEPVLKALQRNYKAHGIAGLTAGLPAKMLLISLGWGVNFFVAQCSTERKEDEPRESLRPKG